MSSHFPSIEKYHYCGPLGRKIIFSYNKTFWRKASKPSKLISLHASVRGKKIKQVFSYSFSSFKTT